jgi:hypothetical protein
MKEGGKIGIRTRNVFFQKLVRRVYLPFRKVASRLHLKSPYVFNQYCFSRKSIHLLLASLGFANIQVINSPLTKGDPYDHNSIRGLITLAKHLIGLVSGLASWMSGGRWVIGPSLLVWAEKPRSIPEMARVNPHG